jgi:hypothetical protein
MHKFVNWALIVVVIVIGIFAIRYVTRPIVAEAHFVPGDGQHNLCHIKPWLPFCEDDTPEPPEPPVVTPPTSEGESTARSRSGGRRRWDVVMWFRAYKAQQELSTETIDSTES